MKVHVTTHGVHLLRGPEVVETLTAVEAMELALDLLGTRSIDTSHAEAYGRIEWLSLGDVALLLRIPRMSASRLIEKFHTTHRRVPGGDRYVARLEVEAWAARALGVVRRRGGAQGSESQAQAEDGEVARMLLMGGARS